MRPLLSAAALAAVMALSACGELDQDMAASRHNAPDEPWRGANNGFMAKNWTPSDKAGWETQLRQRGQLQNEYTKTN